MNSLTSSSAESAPGRRSSPQVDLTTCPICHGFGFIVPDLPLGDPNFGKAVPCQCRSQERRERRLRSLQSLGSLQTLERLTFSTFIPEPKHLSWDRAYNLRCAYDDCVAYAQNPEGWLLLTGSYGCGKTHLAAAIANSRITQGYSAVFMTVPDLLDHLRSAFNPQSEAGYDDLFEQLRNTPLLILDDLGAQSSTPWAQEKLFQLLNHRYNTQLSTVITTNQRLDDLEPRLRSRLVDPDLVKSVMILASDFRARESNSQNDLSTLKLHEAQRFDTFEARRIDSSTGEPTNLPEVIQACREYADRPEGWLVLSGTNGCGKTHLAAAIANDYTEHTRTSVMFLVVPDLLDYLRASFSPQATTSYDRRFDDIKRAPLLVLDDLGTESATPWAREKLFQLLNFRYNALLPTIVTTSFDPSQIEPWLLTRMSDVSRCRWFGITAHSYRGNRSQSTQKGNRTSARRSKG